MGIISVGFGASGLPLCYLTGLGVISVGDGGLEFRSSDEGGGCGGYACPGLISLHLKITLVDESFTISRSWLTLGGGVPPGSARPRGQSIRIQKTKDIVGIMAPQETGVMVGERQGLFELMMTLPEPESCPALSRVLESWPRSALRQELPVATQGPASPGGKVSPGTEGPPGTSTPQAGLVGPPSLPKPGYRPSWVRMAPASECPGRKESFTSHIHPQCLPDNTHPKFP